MPPLDDTERAMASAVRAFIDKAVRPRVRELEHNNEYPHAFIEQMKDMGVFGLLAPMPFAGLDVSMACFASITRELARGWMSLAGAMGGHSVVVYMLRHCGTDEQKARYLPRLATGEIRATMALTEPAGGSDLQAITTTAKKQGKGYVISGTKTWISNARRAGLIALLCKTDPTAFPAHRGISVLLVEPSHGYICSRDLPKLGYKGVEACEVVFSEVTVPQEALLGSIEGDGFRQMMRGLEVGRIQVAARALGVAEAALEDSLRYAKDRQSFGKPIWRHQAVGHRLADMVTRLRAAKLLTDDAAATIDRGDRADMEAGMAKLFASEAAMANAMDAMRIHGGYGYSTEYDIERYFRDAPLMIIGEGTNDIQRNVIAKQLMSRGHVS